MSKKQFFLGIFSASLLSAIIAVIIYSAVMQNNSTTYDSFEQNQQARLSRYLSEGTSIVPEGLNFIAAADVVRPAVVHIKTSYSRDATRRRGNVHDDILREFFGDGHSGGGQRGFDMPLRESSGSGVIISHDGYIVTNNHVISDASKIIIVLDDKRSYTAKVVGTDPTTDLALIKINAENLPFVKYGDSDDVRIGEWVLAVGNPFDLTSTVTAGIVSAKARNINILRTRNNTAAIESFIQTDAAVNPGNSGGALVNLNGELIGINTAIATSTGTYAGYSFAVPVTIVKKVMDDLLQFGEVQRALLGVTIVDITADFAREKGIKDIKGVYIAGVGEESSAEDAKIKEGDIVLKINDYDVNTASELQEIVARYRPGEKIDLTYLRGSKTYNTTAVLKSINNTSLTPKANRKIIRIESLGADFQQIAPEDQEKLQLTSGVKVVRIGEGKLQEAGIRQGFIITSIGQEEVSTPEDVERLTSGKRGGVLVEGIYPDGKKAYYALGW
jgi:serine protease Do